MASDGDYLLVRGDSRPIWCPHCESRCAVETPLYWVSIISVNTLNPNRICPKCRHRNIPPEDRNGQG